MIKTKDDYNWNTYTEDDYKWQIFDLIKKEHNQDLIIKKFDRDNNGDLIFYDNLHSNWKEIYHFVDKLNVESVYECGCGSGQHLINLRILNPKIKLGGSDYSQSQIDLGFTHLNLSNYDISDKLKVIDMTTTLPENFETFDLVYTQAVTMHLSYERAKKFIENMGRISKKYIILIENITQHNYPEMIMKVLPDFKMIKNKKYIDNTIILERLWERK